MSESSLFDLDVSELAEQLVGYELVLPDGRIVTITQTDTFSRTKNDKPNYREMFGMRPGQVFVPRIMGSYMFLVVALEGDLSGACVRIVGIDTDETGEITGSGRVSKYIGFNAHKQTGMIVEAKGKLALAMREVLTPKIPSTNGGTKVKLTDRVLRRYADELAVVFMQQARAEETYDEFISRVKREWQTEAELKRRIQLSQS